MMHLAMVSRQFLGMGLVGLLCGSQLDPPTKRPFGKVALEFHPRCLELTNNRNGAS